MNPKPPGSAPMPAAAIAALLQQARAAHGRNELARAEALYRTVLAAQPNQVDALSNLGGLYQQVGHPRQAAELMARALQLRPEAPDILSNLGVVLLALGRPAEALVRCEAALARLPDHPAIHYNRGNALRALGRLEEALAAYDRAVALQADYAEAQDNRGVVLEQLGRYPEALAAHDRALALRPAFAEAWHNRGVALMGLGRHGEALDSLDRALALRPAFAEALNHRGVALTRLKRHEEALASIEAALALRPDFIDATGNRGAALVELGRPEEALADLDRALAVEPGSARFHGSRGCALQRLGRYPEALAEAELAVGLDPDTPQQRWNLSLVQLAMGDYQQGWANYEWRWRCNDLTPREFPQPLWLGESDLAGRTILVHAEQGLGDTLHFCRLAPQLTARGARVILQVQKPLRAMLQSLQGVAAVLADGDPLPDFDLHCPLLSLPLALGLRVETIPAPIPYLAADPERVAAWQQRLPADGRLRVGLAASGNPGYGNDRIRSMPMHFLAPLLDQPIQAVLLQKDIRPGDQAFLAAHPALAVVAGELADFTDTAALIDTLDLVISVDTSVAHLAGALGKPLWLLQPAVPEWRWLTGRDDSPWYPQARLFRQDRPGDWAGVVARAADAIGQG